MSELKQGHGQKELFKVIGTTRVYLGYSWCLKLGKYWGCHVYLHNHITGFGYHKTNRFTAYRNALKDAYSSQRHLYAKHGLTDADFGNRKYPLTSDQYFKP